MFNSIIGNNITRSVHGVDINTANGTLISKNLITDCQIAVSEEGFVSRYNNTAFENTFSENIDVAKDDLYVINVLFFQNNFVNNTNVISSAKEYNGDAEFFTPETVGSFNWDNGSQGNYWGDYSAKYPNAKEVNETGTYDTPYLVTPQQSNTYPYVYHDYHPLVNPVTFSQNITEMPSWLPPSPTATPSNQAFPNSPIIIIVAVIAAAILAIVILLMLFRRQRRDWHD